jgi:hypothetical protein
MTTFLQAYADQWPTDPKKFKVVLKQITDLKQIKEHSFLLPTNKSGFKLLVDELYDAPKPPEYVTKKEFKKDFIDYTLKLEPGAMSKIDFDALNDYYNDLFNLDVSEATDAAKALAGQFESIFAKQEKEITDFQANLQAELKYNLEYYEEQKAKADKLKIQKQKSSPPPVVPGLKPATKTSRPVQDFSTASSADKAMKGNLPKGIAASLGGIGGDKMPLDPVPEPLLYPDDVILKGKNNSGVIAGRDEILRHSAHTGTGACYMYAGRSPRDIQTDRKDGETGPGDNSALKIGNNLVEDAAYVYLSQKANSDDLLFVAKGTYGKAVGLRKGQSLAAIKADDVVIMARESGIRLITATDTKTSKSPGSKNSISKFGIDLIAGNDDHDLQHLVKGENLVKFLRGLSKSVDDLHSVVYTFLTSQIDMNASLLGHTHYDPFCILLGLLTTGNPVSVNGGKGFVSLPVFVAGIKTLMAATVQQKSAIMQILNRVNNDMNALERFGGNSILSEKNRTN